jgi:aminoglycoside phosphotransferase (APT) family kinase protein
MSSSTIRAAALLKPPLGSRTVVPPTSTIGAMAPMEAIWNSGDAHRLTSWSPKSRRARMSVSDWHCRFWWESTAPLGRPVVPEVALTRRSRWAAATALTRSYSCAQVVDAPSKRRYTLMSAQGIAGNGWEDPMYENLTRLDLVGPALARALGDPGWERLEASLVSGGKSNLTFELTSDAGEAVLRRPPDGPLLPRAHDMGREARVQRALAATPVPVPAILLQDAGELIGVPFYVMEKVDGYVIRDTLPAGWAETAQERHAIADVLVDTLADLHAVDPDEVGLSGFGRPVGLGERQLRRWSEQWERSKSRDVPAVEELGRRLRADPPKGAGGAIVHGDFRIDNCLLARDMPPAVQAVLDWELATLGEPLADLGLFLFYWREPGETKPVLTPAPTMLAGFPPRAYLAERYAKRTGTDLSYLPAWIALAHFKAAAIAQGIAARVQAGSMAGQEFGDIDGEVDRIAADGLALLTGGS